MQFFKNAEFDFAVRWALGDVFHRAADAGEVLATASRIKDGDAEQWYREWYVTAQRMRAIAEKSEANGHGVSARDASCAPAFRLRTPANNRTICKRVFIL